MSLDGLRALAKRAAASLAKHWKPASIVAGIVVFLAAITWVVLPAPSAEGAMRGHTVEIHRNAQITVRFSQSMNHDSVARAFQIVPTIAGSFSWEGNNLTFTPDNHFEKGVTYEVSIDSLARNHLFKRLSETYRQRFSVLNYPEVAVVAPVDSSIIKQDQRLTVLFDHPLRTLTEETRAPELLVIEPKVKGEYLWLGTTGFEFIPDNGWPAATRFTITVPAGTKTADGGSTIADYVWSFQTENLYAWIDAESLKHDPRQAIKLSFNYPVAPQSVKQAITFSGPRGDESKNVLVNRDTADSHAVLINKAGGFEFGATYTIALKQGFTGGLGDLGLEWDFGSSVSMAEKGLRLLSSDPGEGGEKCPECSVVLMFNNPVDLESARKQITVSPSVGDLDISSWEAGRVYIYAQWKASTKYTITLGAGLKDSYAQTVGKPVKVSFKTQAFRARADLAGYSRYGVLAEALPRVYQVRVLNLTKPFTASVCSKSVADYVQKKGSDCSVSGNKEFETTAPLNDYKVIDLDLDKIAGNRLPLGVYELAINMPELREVNQYYGNTLETRTLMIVNTALTLKTDGQKVLVWATDMKTGQPVGDLDVTLWTGYDEWGNSAPAQGETKKTDKDGLVIFETTSTGLAVSAQSGDHLGFVSSNWNDGISTWNYNLNATYGSRPAHIGYIYTDRRIYRPDQLVYFKGIIRRDTDAKLSVPEFKNAEVSVLDPVGKVVSSQSLPVSAYGSFHGELQLESSMALGGYSIVVTNAGESRTEGGDVRGTFEVREFRRPDFKVDLTTPAQQPTSGQTIRIPVHAEYYHGIPLANAKATYTISRTKLYFQPMQGEWFSYQNSDDYYDCWWYCRTEGEYQSIQDGTLSLDSNGNGTIELPATLTDYDFSANYVIAVTVADINGRTVSASTELPVHLGDFYFGIRADYSGGWDSANADFTIVSVNHDGSILPNVGGTVKFYKRTWSNTQKTNTDGTTFWEWQKTDALIESKAITTDLIGRADVRFTPPDSGEYVAVVEGRDARGNAIVASTNRYVYRGDGSTIRVSDDHQMKVVQNKASYGVGETASLAVQTPYKKAKALVTVERDTIRSYKVIDLGSDNRTVPITIDESATPNIYVSVLTVQGGGSSAVPEFRLGYANLQVNTIKKMLDLHVSADKASYKPGEKVTLTVEAKRDTGSGAQAEVSLAVVDERVVALLGSIDKNILGKFWFPRDIGVSTAQSLTMLVTKVFVSTEGGDGKGGEGKTPAIRGNFKDTAYWNATVQTGSDGRATVTFTLPDNLTSWQVLAIGTTKDTVVGSAETSLVTRRDLMVEPLLPRILRFSDRALIGATVFNSTDSSLTARVSIDSGVLQLTDAAERSVSVAPRSRAAVYWNVVAPKDGTASDITVTAAAGEFKDGFKVSLPLLPYSVPETVSASGLLERNVTETFQIPDDILKNSGEVRVSVQPNIGNGLQRGLDYLVHYPYGCAEQKTSAMIANLMYEQLVSLRVSKGDQAKTDEATANVNEAIKLLTAMQQYDGGFSFWSDSGRSYPFLTAYVFWGLTQAQKAGFSVDANVMDAADNYLRQYMGASYGDDSYDYYLDDAARAQAIYALSERNADGLSGYAATLYENRAKLPADAQAYLAMAYGNIDQGSSSVRADKILGELRNRLVYLSDNKAYIGADDGYYWYFNTEIRSTSLYLQALLKLDAKNETVEKLVHYLVEQRQDGYWYTTQNTAMAMLGLVEYVRANPVNETAQEVAVFLNNTGIDTLVFPNGDVSGQDSTQLAIGDLLKDGDTHQIGLEKANDTRYFYDMTMTTYRQIADITPFENGFTVIADAYALDDDKNEHPLKRVKLGDTVRMRVKLLVPKKHQYVALEAHLPAGLEAVDFSLKTSPQELAGKQEQCVPDWNGKQYCMREDSYEWRWWWENIFKHVELRDDRVFLFADELDPGVYEYQFLAQAITPGEFRVPPTRVYEFYNPKANAHNEGKILTVTPN